MSDTKTSEAAVAQTTERAHHPYSPSTLQNLEACSIFQSRDSQNARSIAGTLAHGVVETGDDHNSLSDEDAHAAAECIEFREERKAFLQAEADKALRAACEKVKDQGTIDAAPYKVQELQEIYLPIDDCKFEDCVSTTAGYVDCALLVRAFCYAELLDWKFGMWPVEDADKNLQGIAYALGLFRKYPWLKAVRFFFKQPHLESITEALFTRAMIPGLYLRVQTVVARARKARELRAKGDWSMASPHVPVCNFCRHIADCPIHLSNALQIAKKFHPLEFPEHIDSHDVLDEHQSGLAMLLSQVVKIWADGFRQRTTDRVLRGECAIPEGFTISQGAGRRSIGNIEQFRKVATRYVTPEELAAAADYSITPIEETITTKAVRGTKTKILEQFQQELIDSGAVTPGEKFTFLRVKAEKKEKGKKE